MPLSAEDAAAIASASLDADEELAMALFHEFAESLENVPEEVRREPERYDAYVRAQLEAQLEAEQEQRADAPIGQQARSMMEPSRKSCGERALERELHWESFGERAAVIIGRAALQELHCESCTARAALRELHCESCLALQLSLYSSLTAALSPQLPPPQLLLQFSP